MGSIASMIKLLVSVYLPNTKPVRVFRHCMSQPSKFKGESVSFSPCVNDMERRPYWVSLMEVSYCTFGFGAVIRRDLGTLSLTCNLSHNNHYARVIKSMRERQLKLAWQAYLRKNPDTIILLYDHKAATAANPPLNISWSQPMDRGDSNC